MGNKCKLDPKKPLISNKLKNTVSGQTKLTFWQNKFKTDKERSDQTKPVSNSHHDNASINSTAG